MITENELDVIKAVDPNENKEELNNVISLNTEESSVQNEQINIEKPKRAGRKKRDVTSVSENLNNDMDTQPLFEQPIIVEGKRSRKPTSRLELSDLATPKKELSIPQGHGTSLGEIEYINYQITHAATEDLSLMRNICFGRRASTTNIRKNLQDFNGFEFERASDEYQRHLSNLIKLKKDQLRSLSDILGLSVTGHNDEQAEKILNFLMEPIDDGKKIPERKFSMRSTEKSSTNLKESIPTDEEENEVEEKIENGDDEYFDDEEEEEEEEETDDDDYIGSDEESGLNTKDDPDDFVYRPGKKTPKKRASIKRSRSRSTPKRKRSQGASIKSKRGRKKSKVIIKKTIETEDMVTIPTESIPTNDEEIEKTDNITETKNNDLNNIDTKLLEQHDTTPTDQQVKQKTN